MDKIIKVQHTVNEIFWHYWGSYQLEEDTCKDAYRDSIAVTEYIRAYRAIVYVTIEWEERLSEINMGLVLGAYEFILSFSDSPGINLT